MQCTAGHSRVVPWVRLPQAAALLAALADLHCHFEMIVIGEYKRDLGVGLAAPDRHALCPASMA
jgi:hypothetical protein